jgi:nucleoside-diphosphate-sugar epimerase
VARALIVGCGCRGRALGARLLDEGWAVRGTSRGEQGLAAIEAAGIEAALADPDRPGSVLELVDDVAVVAWLLGSAAGEAERLEAIHGSRLERILERLVETPVRGFVYEAAGSVPRPVLEAGEAAVARAGERWRIPFACVAADPDEPLAWGAAAFDAVSRLAPSAGESI